MSDQRLWILSLGSGQPLRIFEQGSEVATLNRTDLDWGHGKRTKVNESVRISLQPKLQWTREVKKEIDKTLSFPSLVTEKGSWHDGLKQESNKFDFTNC